MKEVLLKLCLTAYTSRPSIISLSTVVNSALHKLVDICHHKLIISLFHTHSSLVQSLSLLFASSPSPSHTHSPHPPAQSPIEQVQNQTEQLSREVKSLQYELMEKNNRMEKLLMMLAKKQGIQWDSEEEEEEAHLHP